MLLKGAAMLKNINAPMTLNSKVGCGMKVLIINSVCGIGSTGRISTYLADKYMSQGNEVKIGYGRSPVPEKYRPITYQIGSGSFKMHALKARLFDNEGFNAIRQTKKFIKWAEEYNPDLLWLHNLHGYYLNIELLFRWIKTRPKMEVRWTLHDCWAFTGHCSHFSYVQCDLWKRQCSRCPQKREYPKSVFLDHSEENYRRKRQAFMGVHNMTLITPSMWLANLVKQSFLKEYPIQVIYNSIDTTVFRPTPSAFRKQYGLENKKIVLGVSAIWNQRKGFEDFIQLSKLLNSSYTIVLVGLAPRQIKKLPASIIGIEKTSSVFQLAEIYTAADVFVNLTYEDTYPTVNLEAKSCGTVCLTYRTGGSVESVVPEYVVDRGDVAAMATMIRKVCSNG